MSVTGDARDAGTTLIETLVVMAIAALVSALVFPNLEGAWRAAGFAQERSALLTTLRSARATAIREQTRIDVTVEPDGRRYGWTGGPDHTLPAGMTVQPAGAAASFFADGSASGGGIALAGAGRMQVVSIEPATGALVSSD